MTAFLGAADRNRADLTVSVALRDPQPADCAGLIAAGTDELVLVEAPPPDPVRAEDWVGQLATRWMPAVRS